MINRLLQIEIVDPEGYKLKWVLIILIVLVALYFLVRKIPTLKLKIKPSRLHFKLKKNKTLRPSTLYFKIDNRSKTAINIQHPVIRFKKEQDTKAYKIKTVNALKIYPLHLEKGKKHQLSIALQPFYDFNPNLKEYKQVRIEFAFNNSEFKKSNYLFLFPSLFKKKQS